MIKVDDGYETVPARKHKLQEVNTSVRPYPKPKALGRCRFGEDVRRLDSLLYRVLGRPLSANRW